MNQGKLFCLSLKFSLSHHQAQISLWRFTKLPPRSRKPILLFSWLNERKTPVFSLSPWNWSDTHAPSSQSCSSAEPCQIMTALAVVPCHKQIHLCAADCLTTPTSESSPKHICSRRMCSRYFLFFLFFTSGFKSVSRHSWEIRGMLKDLEDSLAAMKALSRFEENGATWFQSWHSTAGSFDFSDHTH